MYARVCGCVFFSLCERDVSLVFFLLSILHLHLHFHHLHLLLLLLFIVLHRLSFLSFLLSFFFLSFNTEEIEEIARSLAASSRSSLLSLNLIYIIIGSRVKASAWERNEKNE